MSAWANRRAAVQAETEALERAKDEAVVAESHAALAEKTEAEVLEDLQLPNPDEMQAGDDFTAFNKTTVPSALRNRALRKLWLSNPALANVDMLVDYGEDFTGKNDPIGAIQTLYKVGKGMLRDEEETVEAVSEEPEIEEEDEFEELDVTPAPLPVMEESAEPALAPRRRMRFEFVEGDTPATTGTEV